MVYYIPCIVALAFWGLEAFPRITLGSTLRVATAAAVFALLFATEANVAWLFALTLLMALGVLCARYRRNLLSPVRDCPKQAGILLGIAFLAFLIGLIPFILIYIPVRPIVPLRTYYQYLGFAPTPLDLLNVGRWNLVWGWLVESVFSKTGPERAGSDPSISLAGVSILHVRARPALLELPIGRRVSWGVAVVVAVHAENRDGERFLDR